MQYPMSDDPMKAGQHAATIARLKYMGLERCLVPEAKSETATVTFIKYDGRTYAVTARHVIQTFDSLAKNDGRQFEGYSYVQGPGVAILEPFLTPPANYSDREPDIAICPIHEELPDRIGKTPFEIRPHDDARWPVTHALTVGFPTVEKHDVKDGLGGTRLALPCVHAVADPIHDWANSPGFDQRCDLAQLFTVRTH